MTTTHISAAMSFDPDHAYPTYLMSEAVKDSFREVTQTWNWYPETDAYLSTLVQDGNVAAIQAFGDEFAAHPDCQCEDECDHAFPPAFCAHIRDLLHDLASTVQSEVAEQEA